MRRHLLPLLVRRITVHKVTCCLMLRLVLLLRHLLLHMIGRRLPLRLRLHMLMRAARPTHAAEGGSQPAPLRVHPPSADDTPALPSGT